MIRRDNAVPSPLVNWTEQWMQKQVDCVLGSLQKMVSKPETSILEEMTTS